MLNEQRHIVIIGAGFAGLKLARQLNNDPHYTITLVDKNNYHQFQPLLYQVAMASLDASNISFPLRDIFKNSSNVRIRVATVKNIDTHKNVVETTLGNLNYDYLVIATGAVTNYFGNAAIEKNTFPMKSTWEALVIRNSLLEHFETAVSSKLVNVEKLLSIVVVGGGPTGVELSGSLAEMKNESLPFQYPELDFSKMDIFLVEGSDKLLGNMRETSSQTALHYLQKMGVNIKLNTFVKQYDGTNVLLQDGSTIESSLVIWAAGVKGNVPSGIDKNLISKSNQIKTDIYNRVSGFENVFAVGDIALIESEKFPRGYPQLAAVAIDQAKNVAHNFILLAQNKPLKPYSFFNKGTMATIGRNKAVVDLSKPTWSFKGFFAWLIWMMVHLFLLIEFKNRLVVFINWLYNYFTRRQSLSLLFEQIEKQQTPNIETRIEQKKEIA